MMYILDTNTPIYFFKGIGNVADKPFHFVEVLCWVDTRLRR